MDAALAQLCQDFWDAELVAAPLSASHLGDHRFDAELPDPSTQGQESQRARFGALAERAADLNADGLDSDDRVTVAVLRSELSDWLDRLDAAFSEFTVSPTMAGPHVQLLEVCPNLKPADAEQAAALVARYRGVPRYLARACERLRAGTAAGRTPPAHAVARTVRQLDEYLAAPVDEDPLLTPARIDTPTASIPHAWADDVRAALAEAVRPALADYRAFLTDELLPTARPPERSGLAWIPDGDATYERAIRIYVADGYTPEELHQIGRDAVEGLADEYRQLGGAVLGTTDLAAIFDALRNDPALRFETGEQVRLAAEEALERAQRAVPAWFGRLPETGCVVREMLAHEVQAGTIAYYNPPPMDGTRPGSYYVNTYAPHTRTRFESEALAFHEAVPGHHLQIALARELTGLPAFRRYAPCNAYIEGWALYAERLSDEMGLYSDERTRLGMLSFDSWRSGRLVVDTGLHHFGWSRDQAIAYLRDRSPLALNNIDNEVDRYIAVPGQALGYKVGQREIFRLRDQARSAFGDAFDIRDFHDAVLTQGPLPLQVLAQVVGDWLDRSAFTRRRCDPGTTRR